MRRPAAGAVLRVAALLVLGVPVLGCEPSPDGLDSAAEAEATAARAPPDSSTAPLGTLADLLAQGEELHLAGDVDSARALFNRVLRLTADGGVDAARARALTWLGLGAWRRWELEEARRLGEEALALKLREGLSEQLAESYNALGLTAWYDGRLADAAELYDLALDHSRASGDEETLTKVLGNLGLVQMEFGDFVAARRNLREQAKLSRAAGHQRLEANALTNLAMLEVLEGDPHAAVSQLHDALGLYRSIGYETGEENALSQLGTAYRDMGDFSRAHAAYDSALSLARSSDYPDSEAQNLELLAELYSSAGDSERALRFLADARAINEAIGDDVYAGIDARQEAGLWALVGDPGLADARARHALDLHRASGAALEEFRDLLLLAELRAATGDTTGSELWLAEARALARDFATPLTETALGLTDARIADLRGHHDETLATTERLLLAVDERGHASQWEVWNLRAGAFLALAAVDSAVAAGREALDAIERVRSKLGSGPLRSSYASARRATYADLTLALVRSGNVQEAFQVSDALRARGAYERASKTGVPAEAERLLRQIDWLTVALDSIRSLPQAEVDQPTALGMEEELRDARHRYEDLLIQLSEEHAARSVAEGVFPVEPSEVQAALGPGEVVLEYLVAGDRVLIFRLTRETVSVVEAQIAETSLRTRVRVARDLIGSPTGDSAIRDQVLAGLFDVLIRPAFADELQSASRLIVIPHGVLSYLPFGALRRGVKGPYLAESLAVAHASSAASLLFARTARQGRAPPARDAVQVFVPFPEQLPASADEADWLSEVAPSALVAIGPKATEGRLRASLARGGMVHVATHGVMNPKSPMFSRLEMRRGGDTSQDDGRLEIHEVLGIEVAADLVYLSGCETALGPSWATEFNEGEDYATLAKAFLLSGAANVIATLWRVEDLGSAVFARAFYRALEDSAPQVALVRAQRTLISDDEYSAPYYWAAYRLTGGASWESGLRSQAD
jgi:CHAT domain-containing protein/tetratricopeptide (TPR) repeat protein